MIRIDPRLPVLWRTPTSLQIGLDPALVRIDDVTVGLELLLAELRNGVPDAALHDAAVEAEVDPAEAAALVRRLAPVLIAPEPRLPTVSVDGPRALADAVSADLAALGVPQAAPETCDVIVLTGHHVLAPARSVRWLSEDRPHLPLLFADQAVLIGPLVLPGRTPCLRCADERRIERDPAWPAVVMQLLGRRRSATGDDPLARAEAASRLTRALAQRGPADRIRIDRATGAVSVRPATWHRACSCRGLDGAATPAPRRAA